MIKYRMAIGHSHLVLNNTIRARGWGWGVMKLMAKSTHKCYLPSMELNRIKRLALQAVVSDDYLMETLVLKGGNAIDLIYKVAQRASLDLDFSMSGDFDQETLAGLENRISSQLSRTFEDAGFHVLDVTFSERPSKCHRSG